MKQAVVLIALSVLIGSGCEWEPGIDKAKFAGLSRTVQNVKTFIASDKGCDLPEAELTRLASEAAALKERTGSKAEKDVIQACSNLLTLCRDGLLLCSHIRHSQFRFVPRGRVYVFQELDPLVKKYGLATRSHVYEPTGLSWRSIDADAISVIWESASVQIRSIETMMKYN